MQEVAKTHEASVARVALAWMLRKKGVTSIIIGAKNLEQLRDNIAATTLILSATHGTVHSTPSANCSNKYPGWMVERQADGRMPK